MKLHSRINKLRKSENAVALLSSGAWVLASSVLSRGLLLFATIIVAKFIDKNVYGEFGIIRSTVNMFVVFGAMGLGITATKFIAQYKDTDAEKTANILSMSNTFSSVFSLVISVVIIIFSQNIADYINAGHLKGAIQLSSIIILFSSLNGVQSGILSGFEKFRTISVNNIIAAFTSAIAQIVGAYWLGLKGVIIGFGINFLALFFLNWISINAITKGRYKVDYFNKKIFKEARILWEFSLPAVLSSMMIGPIIWLTNSFLVNSPNGYDQMANFDIANQWRTTILFIPGVLSQVLFPLFSKRTNQAEAFNRLFNISIIINFCVALFLISILIPFTGIILNYYGNNYLDGKPTFIIMLVTTVLVAVNNVIGQVITSKNKAWVGLFANLLWALVLVGFSFYFIKMEGMGAKGLAYAYLFSYIFHSVVQYMLYKFVLFKEKSDEKQFNSQVIEQNNIKRF